MVAPIKQTVMVREDGSIEIRSPQLRPGARAEVVVYVEEPMAETTIAQRLAALDRLQTSLNLYEDQMRARIEDAREIRRGIGRNVGQ